MNAARGIADDAWTELQRAPLVQMQRGLTPERLPDVSFEEAQRRSATGRGLIERLDALDASNLPADEQLTLRLVRFRAAAWAREEEWYWLAADPLKVGIPGMFLPTAYCGGWLLSFIHGQLSSFPFADSADTDRYLSLVSDYARLIGQFAERTTGQAERGIYMPRVQVFQARRLLSGLKAQLRETLGVAAGRLHLSSAAGFLSELERRIAGDVEPAFDRVLAGLSAAYLAAAPEAVGLAQYPGGAEVYAQLLKLHTTLDTTPAEVHERGLERMAQLEAHMASIRRELGFSGNQADFLAHLKRDARWRADTVEGVTGFFQRYIDRLQPRFDDYFPIRPRSEFGVAPLPAMLEGSMTYGYYEPPGVRRSAGRYFFNAANLTREPLFALASLTYHELMPGHHLHFALQQENEKLHPFRRYSFVNAFNEGWAEYAATLAGEMGLYEEPEERYGRLVNEAFLTSRLVVDTGMNALGWSLDRAQDYMRRQTALSESEVQTDSIRYSCDIPGQALAYKIGDTCILELRERVRRERGEKFSIRDFHASVLSAGALPLPDLEWHIGGIR